MPEDVAYIEPFRRRVRGAKDGQTVVDSERVLLVHRPGRPPAYAFPAGDVQRSRRRPEPDSPGYVTVGWDAADAWFEEDEQVFGHARNPYHRVDCLRSGRRLRVEAGGVTLVDTTETLAVYETALEPRLYVDPRLVRTDVLSRSATHTYCPYKGTASYWTARVGDAVLEDVAWSYEDPLPESTPLGRFLSFDETRVDPAARPARRRLTDPEDRNPPPLGCAAVQSDTGEGDVTTDVSGGLSEELEFVFAEQDNELATVNARSADVQRSFNLPRVGSRPWPSSGTPTTFRSSLPSRTGESATSMARAPSRSRSGRGRPRVPAPAPPSFDMKDHLRPSRDARAHGEAVTASVNARSAVRSRVTEIRADRDRRRPRPAVRPS